MLAGADFAAAFPFAGEAAFPPARPADLALLGFALLVAVVTEDLDFLVLALVPERAEVAEDLAGFFLLANLLALEREDPVAVCFPAPPLAAFFATAFLASDLPTAFFLVPTLARDLPAFLPPLLADARLATGRFLAAAVAEERLERDLLTDRLELDFDTAFFATMDCIV